MECERSEYRETLIAVSQQSGQAIVDELAKKNFLICRPQNESSSLSKRKALAVSTATISSHRRRVSEVAWAPMRNHLWIVGVNNTGDPASTRQITSRRSQSESKRPRNSAHWDHRRFRNRVRVSNLVKACKLLIPSERRHFAQYSGFDGKSLLLTPEQVADYNRLQAHQELPTGLLRGRLFSIWRAKSVTERPNILGDPDRPRVMGRNDRD